MCWRSRKKRRMAGVGSGRAGVVQKEARKANRQIMRSPDFKSDGETSKGLKISWSIYF